MQPQASSVQVVTKDETYTMPSDRGKNLMTFLASENNVSHVMITDIKGQEILINKHDIRKVIPTKPTSTYKTFDELDISKSKRDETGEGYKKYLEMKKNLLQ